MTLYTGNVGGEFVWTYIDMEVHKQDPFLLVNHGGILEESFIWTGCHCQVKDNNHSYCMECYSSEEEHEEQTDYGVVKQVAYEMVIDRKTFDEQCRPWLEERESKRLEIGLYMSYKFVDSGVVYDTWMCRRVLNKYAFIQEYCLLTQIDYFFDHTEKDECRYRIID